MKRSLAELTATAEPAWPLVQDWIATAIRPVEVLPPSASAPDCLVSLQISTRSPMGAVIINSGGLLIDHGWLRVLGSGHPRLPRSLPEWSFECGLVPSDNPPPWLLVADDVFGGFFALNGGRFSPDGHTLWYFAPERLAWEDLDVGYTEFLQFAFSGDLEKFYEGLRWRGWEEEVHALSAGDCLLVYPPLTTAGAPIAYRERRAVPVSELFALHVGAV